MSSGVELELARGEVLDDLLARASPRRSGRSSAARAGAASQAIATWAGVASRARGDLPERGHDARRRSRRPRPPASGAPRSGFAGQDPRSEHAPRRHREPERRGHRQQLPLGLAATRRCTGSAARRTATSRAARRSCSPARRPTPASRRSRRTAPCRAEPGRRARAPPRRSGSWRRACAARAGRRSRSAGAAGSARAPARGSCGGSRPRSGSSRVERERVLRGERRTGRGRRATNSPTKLLARAVRVVATPCRRSCRPPRA